jgi:hypothetical protein
MPVGSLIPALTRPVFRRKSPAGAQLLADWPGVVGPALSAVTSPLRLSAGTLTIACAGPVAMELQHLAPELIGRYNGHLAGRRWSGSAFRPGRPGIRCRHPAPTSPAVIPDCCPGTTVWPGFRRGTCGMPRKTSPARLSEAMTPRLNGPRPHPHHSRG